MEKKTVLITVGTTLFEDLIKKFDEDDILKIMIKYKYHNIMYQIGKGTYEPINWKKYPELNVEIFKFKPSLIDDVKKADLIITHCGAGTLLECLRLKKKIIAVNNDLLMGNHQLEILEILAKDDYIFGFEKVSLVNTKLDNYLSELEKDKIKEYPLPKKNLIQNLIDELI